MNTEIDPTGITTSFNYAANCDATTEKHKQLFTIAGIPRDCYKAPLSYETSLFVMKYEVLPCVMSEGLVSGDVDDDISGSMGQASDAHISRSRRTREYYYHTRSILQFLTEQYHADSNKFLSNGYYDVTIDASVMTHLYINLGNYLAIAFKQSVITTESVDNPNSLQPDIAKRRFQCFSKVKIFHVPQSAERARTLLKQLQGFKIYALPTATLKMVRQGTYLGFDTTPIRMKKPHILDLRLHYGDDFPEIHIELLKALQEKNSTGITFLHGPPGTGKTYYLRYLINELKDKPLIYLPPDLVHDITKPSFLTFLMKHPNSILIIEDAENIIHDRQDVVKSSNQAVSNLLNMSDGLLGDAVHQQIICTFNCDIRNIDSALVRDGRLVLEHKFDKLSVENARRLCEKLGVENKNEDIREPMSLAEIYARTNPDEQTTEGSELNGTHKKKNRRTLKRSPKEADACTSLYC